MSSASPAKHLRKNLCHVAPPEVDMIRNIAWRSSGGVENAK